MVPTMAGYASHVPECLCCLQVERGPTVGSGRGPLFLDLAYSRLNQGRRPSSGACCAAAAGGAAHHINGTNLLPRRVPQTKDDS